MSSSFLFERTELREPWLGLVDGHQLSGFETIVDIDDVEVCFVNEDVVVQRPLCGLLNPWTPFLLIGVVEG